MYPLLLQNTARVCSGKARKKVGRKGGQRGGITVPDLLLTKMISNDNRNRVQREAMIDTMNKPQIR